MKKNQYSNPYFCWTICDRADSWNNFIGGIIGSLLTDGPSAPLYAKLIESGLGSDYATGTGFLAYLKDSLFIAGLRDAREADLGKFFHVLALKKLEYSLFKVMFLRKTS